MSQYSLVSGYTQTSSRNTVTSSSGNNTNIQNNCILLVRSAEFFIGTNDHKTEIQFTRLLYWHVKYQVTRSTPDIASMKACENKFLIILKLMTSIRGATNYGETRQECTYWGAIAQLLLQRKSDKYYVFSVSICRLRYRACNEDASFCHMWHGLLYNIFP